MNIKCGKLAFKISHDKRWDIPINAKKFEDNDSEINIYYRIKFVDSIKYNNEPIVCQREHILVTKNDHNFESRYLMIPGNFYPYAYYREDSDKKISIEIIKDFKNSFTIDTMFWSLFALEKHLIKEESIIFHCSYMVYKGYAVLFSGPSGIGKSTQSRLWEKNRNTRIINGDRALLVKEDKNWYVNGWPVCGSSEICTNEKHELGSIVFLGKSNENSVVRLERKYAIKKLISQITINYWNKDFVNKAISLAENIVDNIKIYELTCTPDIEAVKVLEKFLEENEEWIH
ncbi:hypothetical protein K0040_00025 [Terrisporobacter petrolearius]|uniref:hypothetical protein n=1 Tax=Terrisporobacter petrolearius TaxID=1460447 RepID=UPI001D16CAA0|nr:hypothetical protein [Terrisporobacter petrolearius]MCC3862698.1 hypothetical protein [Terrisporobacter petrolearius]